MRLLHKRHPEARLLGTGEALVVEARRVPLEHLPAVATRVALVLEVLGDDVQLDGALVGGDEVAVQTHPAVVVDAQHVQRLVLARQLLHAPLAARAASRRRAATTAAAGHLPPPTAHTALHHCRRLHHTRCRHLLPAVDTCYCHWLRLEQTKPYDVKSLMLILRAIWYDVMRIACSVYCSLNHTQHLTEQTEHIYRFGQQAAQNNELHALESSHV